MTSDLASRTKPAPVGRGLSRQLLLAYVGAASEIRTKVDVVEREQFSTGIQEPPHGGGLHR